MAEPVNDVTQVIGENIHTRRVKLGLSQWGLSRKSGVSQSVLSRVERGHIRISADRLYDIAVALNTTVGQIFQGI